MSGITPCLWFDGNAEEAAKFYASLFPNSHVDAVHRAPSDYPSGKTDDVLLVEFTLMGQPFTGLNGGPQFKFNEAISFQIPVDRRPIGRRMRRSRRICGSLWSRTARRLRRRGAGIHAEDLRHLRPLRPRAGADLKRRAGWHAVVTTALDDAHMEEGVARAITKRDEAKAFVGVVPLDGSSDGGARRAVELWATRRRIAEITGRRFVVVVIEITAAVRAKISVSAAHVTSWG